MRTALLLLALPACSRENTFRLPKDAYDTGCAAPPVLDLGTELLSFGELGASESATRTLTARNTGDTRLGIAYIQGMANGVGDDGAFKITVSALDGAEDGAALGLAWVLEPGGALELTVSFAPEHNGIHWGGVLVSTNDAGEDEGPDGVHMARRTAFGRVLFKGEGRGAGGSAPEVFLVGGIYPDVYAVEPGGSVRLQWATYDPYGRYSGSPVSLTDQDGALHALEGWSIDWTAPAEEPVTAGFARQAGFVREDADGVERSATATVFVWPTDGIDDPICN
jgi:hypothetical protein